jgi:hypothetical protein
MSFAFSYNGVVCSGGSAHYRPVGRYRYEAGAREFRFAADVVVVASGATAFASAAAAFEAGIRGDDGALSISVGGASMIALDPAGGGVFDVRGSVAKSAGPDDGPRNRRYTVTVTGRFADGAVGSNRDGFTDERIAVTADATGRRVVTLTGEIAAASGTSARDRHDDPTSGTAARAAAALAALASGASFDLIATEIDDRADGRSLTYARKYRERLVTGDIGGGPAAGFGIDALTVTRLGPDPGESAVAPAWRVVAKVAVDAAMHAPADLAALYRETIRAALLAHLTGLGLGSDAGPTLDDISREELSLDPAASRLAIDWRLRPTADGDASLLSHELSTTIERDRLVDPLPLGAPGAYALQLPGERVGAVVESRAEHLRVRPPGISPPAPPTPGSLGLPADSHWVRTGVRDRLGSRLDPDGGTIHTIECRATYILAAGPGARSPWVAPGGLVMS